MNWSREITHLECHSEPFGFAQDRLREESLITCEIRSSSNGQGYFASNIDRDRASQSRIPS